jgi:hypothetical protein
MLLADALVRALRRRRASHVSEMPDRSLVAFALSVADACEGGRESERAWRIGESAETRDLTDGELIATIRALAAEVEAEARARAALAQKGAS